MNNIFEFFSHKPQNLKLQIGNFTNKKASVFNGSPLCQQYEKKACSVNFFLGRNKKSHLKTMPAT